MGFTKSPLSCVSGGQREGRCEMAANTWELARKKFPKMEDSEFELVKAIGVKYGLDPLIGELIAYRMDGEIKMFTTRDGYLGIAHRTGAFDRMNTVVIVEDPDGKICEMDVVPSGWKLIGAKCYLYKVGNPNPLILSVPLEEYYREKWIWKRLSQTMIKKVAESQALRKAFNICGVYAEEERDAFDSQPATEAIAEVEAKKIAIEERKICEMGTSEQALYLDPTMKLMARYASVTDSSLDAVKGEYLERIKAGTLEELTVVELRKLYSLINADLKGVLADKES